jgi:ABC-type transport system involved in cytochrome bd biosynthesis fused ATPase/permease subunit
VEHYHHRVKSKDNFMKLKTNLVVWVVAFADLFDALIKIISFGFIKPYFGFMIINKAAKKAAKKEMK